MAALHAGRRLLTLVGPPGVGKTRLVTRFVRNLGDSATRWFVDLTKAECGADVVPLVLDTLGVRLNPNEAVSVSGALNDQPVTLVFDNCEHVVDECRAAIVDLLTSSPLMRVIATSRVPLGISGEAVWHVEPLPSPGAAVELFVDRASTAPSFDLDRIANVCVRLDGLPLAIEIAASQLAYLTLGELECQLHAANGSALQATFDSSYALLDAGTARLFRELAVFRGGFTAEAAAAVAAADLAQTTARLRTLVDQSLVVAPRPADAQMRYALLHSVKQYGLDRLTATRELDPVRAAHARYFAQEYIALSDQLNGALDQSRIAALDAELENVEAALETLLRDAVDPELGGNLCLALQRFWFARGRVIDAIRWVESALALRQVAGDLRLRLLFMRAVMGRHQNDYRGTLERYAEILAIQRERGDEYRTALTLIHMSGCLTAIGDAERASEYALLAKPALDAAGGPDVGYVHVAIGLAQSLAGDTQEAERQHLAALQIFREGGADEIDIAATLSNLATCALQRGRAQAAHALAAESIRMARASGASFVVGASQVVLAEVAIAGHDLSLARNEAEPALRIAAETNDYERLAEVAETIARLAASKDDSVEAARALAAAATLRRRCGAVRNRFAQSAFDELERELRVHLEDARFEAFIVAAQAMPAAGLIGMLFDALR